MLSTEEENFQTEINQLKMDLIEANSTIVGYEEAGKKLRADLVEARRILTALVLQANGKFFVRMDPPQSLLRDAWGFVQT